MKKLSNLFFILFLFCGSFMFSQNHKIDETTGLPNDLDSKYTPDKTSLFNSSSDVYIPGSRNANAVTIKNVISFDVTNLARSSATFFYERALNKVLGVQVGIGTTFAKDQIQQTFIPVGLTFFGEGSSDYGYNSSLSLTDILKNCTNNKSGIFLAANLKLYVSGSAPKGVFFQFGTTYAVNNLQFTNENNSTVPVFNSNSSTTAVGSPQNIAVRNLNFNFNWGYQFVVGVGKVKFVNTVYAGFGIKKITYTDVVSVNNYNYSANPNYPGNYYIIDGSQKTIVVPTMIIGFSMGVGL